MTDPSDHLPADLAEIPNLMQQAGVAGAGGAGFPSYVKWQALDQVDALLVNHQESEPNCYGDKWLGRERTDELCGFVEALLESAFDTVVVGTKAKYRDEWMAPLEASLDFEVCEPDDLPHAVGGSSGPVLAYTPDVYTYSEESVLLMVTTGTQIGDDLPTEHGWIVHNTESLYNIARAVTDGTPVTRKYVHVGGDTPRHRCLEAPIGTPGDVLLEAAGVDDGALGDGQVMADGGPGWCYEIEGAPAEFGVRKRTNALLVLDADTAREHTQPDGQIDVLTARDWTDRDHETTPTPIAPDVVRIPLITNAAYEGFVIPSVPTVEPGDDVAEGDVIAAPSPDGISIAQHASIDGTVADVTGTHVIIERA